MDETELLMLAFGVMAVLVYLNQRNASAGTFDTTAPDIFSGIIPRTVSADGIDFIKSQEGFAATPTADSYGHQTIGYGHTIANGESYSSISQLAAANLLDNDLVPIEDAINASVNVPLNQNQYDALADFIYNVGITAFKNSTLLQDLNNSDYASAANQFSQWVHTQGNISQGLVNRRTNDQNLFNS